MSLIGGITLASDSHAGDTLNVLVLRENGIGSAAQAQPHVDKLISRAASKNGWSSAKGKYLTRRKIAKKYIRSKKPKFGMVSLGAYLALKKSEGLVVLGNVDVKHGGGRRYHLVSKSGSGLTACKGKKLASNHIDDARFVDQVISGGDFKLSDFKLVKTRRPVQTLKKVIRDKAACALIDDAQLKELPHIDGGKALKSVWKSKQLPAMPVVAFSGASQPERAKFKASLGSICKDAGKKICDKIGIKSLKSAGDGDYSAVVSAYGK